MCTKRHVDRPPVLIFDDPDITWFCKKREVVLSIPTSDLRSLLIKESVKPVRKTSSKVSKRGRFQLSLVSLRLCSTVLPFLWSKRSNGFTHRSKLMVPFLVGVGEKSTLVNGLLQRPTLIYTMVDPVTWWAQVDGPLVSVEFITRTRLSRHRHGILKVY